MWDLPPFSDQLEVLDHAETSSRRRNGYGRPVSVVFVTSHWYVNKTEQFETSKWCTNCYVNDTNSSRCRAVITFTVIVVIAVINLHEELSALTFLPKFFLINGRIAWLVPKKDWPIWDVAATNRLVPRQDWPRQQYHFS